MFDVGGVVIELGGIWRCAHGDFEEKDKEYNRQQNSGLGVSMKPPLALAVSRAFGARQFKFCDGKRVNVVSSCADVEHVELLCGKTKINAINKDNHRKQR